LNSLAKNDSVIAPIALFVYNRFDHTRQTVEALKKNALCSESELIIFSDAPKTETHSEAVDEVREYIRQIEGFRSVTLVERETNFGLARSIIDGVTKLCDEYGRVIVLEDDLVTSPYFLEFMNDALNIYEHEDQVMQISGFTYPVEQMEDETFFLRLPLCWGWATWDRAWRHFRKSDDVMLKFDRKMRNAFSFNNSYHFWRQLELNQKGRLNTWFVYWYAALFLRGGLALYSGRSLVHNIGMDGSGVHFVGTAGTTNEFDVELSTSAVQVAPISIKESMEAVRRHEDFFRKTLPPLYVRALRKAVRELRKLAHRTFYKD
jgi:hypothetical protein